MITSAISVVEIDNKFVAIKCAKGRGVIFPGGKRDPGEIYEQTATRELFEETGLIAVSHDFICAVHVKEFDSYIFAFETKIEKYEPVSSTEGEVVLATWEDLLKSSFKDYYLTLRKVMT